MNEWSNSMDPLISLPDSSREDLVGVQHGQRTHGGRLRTTKRIGVSSVSMVKFVLWIFCDTNYDGIKVLILVTIHHGNL